ncbi:MAG: hypothetical protein KGS60_10330 [Verrucomicrobia bacterium]|nr:hypothetical protein [Verrucomicrobiota bacterium]
MTTHEWKESEDDGSVVFYRANHHAGRWSLYRRPKDQPGWIPLDPPAALELRLLLDVLQRKYQRRKVPHAHVLQVEKWLEDTESGNGENSAG